jgi:erythromycin esterase-like protein
MQILSFLRLAATPVLDFIGWLREHNDEQPVENKKCGFYGWDLLTVAVGM